MARFKKPKPPKVKHYPKRWCHLCLAEITDEMTKDSWVFLTHRPCTIPGWQALAIAGVWDPDKAGLPVVWGVTIAVACPTCWPKVDDYQAGIELLMEDEGAEACPSVRSRVPLTTAEITYVLEQVANDHDSRVTVTAGYLVDPEDQEALDDWQVATWDEMQGEEPIPKGDRREELSAKSEGTT